MPNTIAEFDERLAKIESERCSLLKKFKPIEKRLKELGILAKQLQDKRGALIVKGQNDQENNPALLVCNNPHNESTPEHKARNERLVAAGFGFAGGYWTDTNQTTISIALTKHDNAKTQKVFESICAVLPFILPTKESLRRIDIFEHTLSEYCSWSFGTYGTSATDEWVLLRNGKDEEKFPSLMEILKYIQHRLYYQK